MLESPWMPLIYQYSVGGGIFLFGIIAAIRVKALDLSFKKDKTTLWHLIVGYLCFLTFHTIMILVSGV